MIAQIPQQPVGGSLLTNGVLVAIVVLLHIQIAAFIIGASMLACVSEAISLVRRNHDERHDRLTHWYVKCMVYVFGFGSALAIFFLILVLVGYWGKFFVALQQITFPAFFLEAVAFAVEIALLYTLYANWQRLAAHRRARLGMLLLLSLAFWWQMFFIDIVASFMLTPNGGDVDIVHQILNPTQTPLTVHRTIGNIAWAGAVLAFAGALRYVLATRRAERSEAGSFATVPAQSVGAMAAVEGGDDSPNAREARFWDWAAQWGAVWAVGLTLFQPWVGYSYAKEVQLHSYPSWYNMMFGDLSNVFLLQIALLGFIFTIGAAYFWRRMKASGAPHHRRQGVITILLLAVTLFAAQPAWFALSYQDVITAGLDRPWWEGGILNPLGNFIPFKVGCLFAMVFLALWSLTSYMRAVSRDSIRPARMGRRAQSLLLALGALVSVMMIVMGVIREHARQPYLISGELTIQGQQITNTNPSPTGGTTP
ncbi:MAG TPA: hypothetical protein VJU79_10625 [Candidatus Dormibacteraeota bacterium]|nr:hypothetical protein [Candidatus Dormibacteraeota bacterium]